jgi:hypothetical protein
MSSLPLVGSPLAPLATAVVCAPPLRLELLAPRLSNQWASSTCYVNGMPFVDRSPLLFEHVLDVLRSPVPPIFWTRTDGFDMLLYARRPVRRRARFHQSQPVHQSSPPASRVISRCPARARSRSSSAARSPSPSARRQDECVLAVAHVEGRLLGAQRGLEGEQVQVLK